VPQSVRSPLVEAPLTFSTVCPEDVPGAVIPIVIEVLLFEEFVFWKTHGAVKLAVAIPARVTE
jgi:hypothetical protein